MPELTDNQIDVVQTLLQSLCPGLGSALTEQLSRETACELVEIHRVTLNDLLGRSETILQTLFTFTHPEGSDCVFVLSEATARTFADLMEGVSGSETTEPLTDSQIDTLSTGMAGLVRGLSAGLIGATGENYDVESLSTHLGALTVPPVFALDGSAIEVKFSVTVPDLLNAELTGLFTCGLMAELAPGIDAIGGLSGGDAGLSEDDVAEMLSQVASDGYGAAMPTVGSGGVSPSPFPELGGRGNDLHYGRGLDMILDIPLDVTVELGRVRMLIKDVLELASGSIIELDRVAGEPVDLLVNGRLVAKGEVVVIEDNFGIRITEIVSPAERVAGLGRGERR